MSSSTSVVLKLLKAIQELETKLSRAKALQQEQQSIKVEVENLKDKELKQSLANNNTLDILTKQKNEIEKKFDDTVKCHKEEILKLKQQLEASELKAKQDAQGVEAANKEKLEKIQVEKADVEAHLNKKTKESKKLREISRKWKKKAHDFEAEIKQQDDILTGWKQKYETQTAEFESLKAEANEAKEIAEALNPEAQMKLMVEKEALVKEVASHKERQEKAKEILLKLKTANTKLKEEKDNKSKLLEGVLKSSKEESQRLNNELISLKEEKEALNKQIETLKTKLDNSRASPPQSVQTSTSEVSETNEQPTLKRAREAEATRAGPGDDAVAAPSAVLKKAKLLSVNEEIQQDQVGYSGSVEWWKAGRK